VVLTFFVCVARLVKKSTCPQEFFTISRRDMIGRFGYRACR
jgi:hypothetical protein